MPAKTKGAKSKPQLKTGMKKKAGKKKKKYLLSSLLPPG